MRAGFVQVVDYEHWAEEFREGTAKPTGFRDKRLVR